MKVLVVEDDRSIRETLGIVLESYHHHPDLVEGGESALSRLGEAWPDAMLLDLTLRDMAGEDLYARILDRFGRVPPTVVLSAAQDGVQRISRLEGARFLAKPYTLDQLAQALAEVETGARAA